MNIRRGFFFFLPLTNVSSGDIFYLGLADIKTSKSSQKQQNKFTFCLIETRCFLYKWLHSFRSPDSHQGRWQITKTRDCAESCATLLQDITQVIYDTWVITSYLTNSFTQVFGPHTSFTLKTSLKTVKGNASSNSNKCLMHIQTSDFHQHKLDYQDRRVT